MVSLFHPDVDIDFHRMDARRNTPQSRLTKHILTKVSSNVHEIEVV